jgi:hypothetical protein
MDEKVINLLPKTIKSWAKQYVKLWKTKSLQEAENLVAGFRTPDERQLLKTAVIQEIKKIM